MCVCISIYLNFNKYNCLFIEYFLIHDNLTARDKWKVEMKFQFFQFSFFMK